MSEPKVVTFTEWTRSGPIDRTKRVAPGGEVSLKNIIKGTRSRANVNYNENKTIAVNPQRSNVRKGRTESRNVLEIRNQNTIAQLTSATKGLTLKPAPIDESKPVRKRNSKGSKTSKKQEPVEEDVQDTRVEQDTHQENTSEEKVEEEEEDTDYAKFKAGVEIEDDGEDYEAEEDDEADDELNNSAFMADEVDTVEQLEEEAKANNALPLIRDTKRRDKVSDAVISQLKRLGGKIPETIKPSKYKKNTYNMPTVFATLSSTKFEEGVYFKSEKYDLRGLEIVVTDISEWNDFKFLRENDDAIIIAEESNVLVVSKQLSVDNADPQVWLIEENKTEGPYKLSDVLASLEVDDGEDEENEDDDE